MRVFVEKMNKQMTKFTYELDAARMENKILKTRLAYYKNSNTPTSLHSLEYMKEKRKIRKAKENGKLPPSKKPGGRPGHKGVSRKHNPTSTVKHTVKNTKCSCDSTMEYSYTKTRDIIDYKPAVATEIRHMIDVHVCSNYKHVRETENDLPKSGSYGKNVIALVPQYIAVRIPHPGIQELLKATCSLVITKSTIINMISNVSDIMETEAKTITNTVVQSPFANIDKTSYILNGLMVWAWIITYEKNIVIIMNKSRGAYVMDAYDHTQKLVS